MFWFSETKRNLCVWFGLCELIEGDSLCVLFGLFDLFELTSLTFQHLEARCSHTV